MVCVKHSDLYGKGRLNITAVSAPSVDQAPLEPSQCAFLVIPSSPALVHELAPAHQPSHELITTIRRAVNSIRPERIELVVHEDSRYRTEIDGSFAAWGAPHVTVSAGHQLGELVARYALGEHEHLITEVRQEVDTLAAGVLTVVVADGSAGLTDRAPLALVSGAIEADAWCRRLVAGDCDGSVDAAWLSDRGVMDPVPWCQLAEIVGKRELQGDLLAHDTTLGVGRYVGLVRGEA